MGWIVERSTAKYKNEYIVSIAVGIALYFSYASINDAWVNPALIAPDGIDGLGGIVASTLLMTAVSNGVQLFAVWLTERDLGEPDWNVLLALAASISTTALAVSGVPWVRDGFILAGLASFAAFVAVAVALDLRPAAGAGSGPTTNNEGGALS